MLHYFLKVIRRKKRWKKSVNTKSGPAGSAASGSLQIRILEIGRQQTCGAMECQRKWHARKCAEWNRKNRAYFRDIYLRGRLESFGSGPPEKSSSHCSSCRINDPPRRSSPLDLAQEVIQAVIEVEEFIIIEYIVRLLMRAALNSYPYCGHSALMGKRKRPWKNVDYVLHSFGKRVGRARREYFSYVEAGVEQGRRRDLVGGGLIRSLVGWAEAAELRLRGQEHIKSDDLAKSRKAMAA